MVLKYQTVQDCILVLSGKSMKNSMDFYRKSYKTDVCTCMYDSQPCNYKEKYNVQCKTSFQPLLKQLNPMHQLKLWNVKNDDDVGFI